MGRGQKEQLDREVRKFRRRRLVKYHDLEQDLLREVNDRINKQLRDRIVCHIKLYYFSNTSHDLL